MRIFSRFIRGFVRNSPPEGADPASASSPSRSEDTAPQSRDDGAQSRTYPGARRDDAVRARIGGYELRSLTVPKPESPAPTSSQVHNIQDEFRKGGRGLAGVPDNLFRDLLIELPATLTARLEQEQFPRPLHKLHPADRNAIIAIALAQDIHTRRLSTQDLLSVFRALPRVELEQRLMREYERTSTGADAGKLTFAHDEAFNKVGSVHAYQGLSANDISRKLGSAVRNAVAAQWPKGKFGPAPLDDDEHNALVAIVLARMEATKDLCLLDLLDLYHRYRPVKSVP